MFFKLGSNIWGIVVSYNCLYVTSALTENIVRQPWGPSIDMVCLPILDKSFDHITKIPDLCH